MKCQALWLIFVGDILCTFLQLQSEALLSTHCPLCSASFLRAFLSTLFVIIGMVFNISNYIENHYSLNSPYSVSSTFPYFILTTIAGICHCISIAEKCGD